MTREEWQNYLFHSRCRHGAFYLKDEESVYRDLNNKKTQRAAIKHLKRMGYPTVGNYIRLGLR